MLKTYTVLLRPCNGVDVGETIQVDDSVAQHLVDEGALEESEGTESLPSDDLASLGDIAQAVAHLAGDAEHDDQTHHED
jgi:hypothetical protein